MGNNERGDRTVRKMCSENRKNENEQDWHGRMKEEGKGEEREKEIINCVCSP